MVEWRQKLQRELLRRFTIMCVFLMPMLAEAAPYILPNTDVIDLPKSSNGVDYQLYVHVPPDCLERRSKCKTIYMLDADYSFALSVQLVTHLSDRNQMVPVISVAIGYPDKSRYRLSRTRDYTPFFVAEGGYGKAAQALSGGGPEFLGVLTKEIIPYIEKHYPTDNKGRTLTGHSYGGLFALYAWLLAPDTFEQYIIVSPSLWYGDKKVLEEVKNACSKSDFKPSRDMFLAVGEYEEQPGRGRAMVSDLKQLSTQLKTCSTRAVNTHLRVYKDETHASIFPAAYSTGLRTLF